MTTKPDVPFAKVAEIADSYNKLMGMRDAQRTLGATMIRACVKALVREPTPFEDVAKRRQIAKDKRDAIGHLVALADLMDPPLP